MSKLITIDHVQLAMPIGQEAAARHYLCVVLGMQELPKPPHLAGRGGCWFRDGEVVIHYGVEDDFRPMKKAHLALRVKDIRGLAEEVSHAGYLVTWEESNDGSKHFYSHDPFGNRLEFIAFSHQDDG